MTPYTYNSLLESLMSWVQDRSPEFQARLPEIVELGELRLTRDLDLDIFYKTAVVVAPTTGLVPKPVGLLALQSMHYSNAGGVQYVENRGWEYVVDYGTVGAPLYVAEESEVSWRLAPTPDFTYQLSLRYIARPTPLAGSPGGTWLSTNTPDLLLKACLISCESYLKDDPRIAVWLGLYVAQLKLAKDELKRQVRRTYG
jgi:hypothetical protein